MNLYSQVTSLELSKLLKELGVSQKSLFYWIKEEEPYIWYNCQNFNYPMNTVKWFYSAFTASELLEMLPDYIDMAGNLKIKKHDVRGEGITYFVEYGYGYYEHQDKNLSNALAKTLIHLIEQKIIEV
jgi:hypothetical protein